MLIAFQTGVTLIKKKSYKHKQLSFFKYTPANLQLLLSLIHVKVFITSLGQFSEHFESWSCLSQSGVLFLFFVLFTIKKKLLFKYSCLHFPTPLSPTQPLPPPTLNPSPLCLCLCVLYTSSLTSFPLLSLLFSSPLPSGYCQFVLYFNASGSILLICFFCWLGSTYRWDHTVFVFHMLVVPKAPGIVVHLIKTYWINKNGWI